MFGSLNLVYSMQLYIRINVRARMTDLLPKRTHKERTLMSSMNKGSFIVFICKIFVRVSDIMCDILHHSDLKDITNHLISPTKPTHKRPPSGGW